jgi:hypothetical protein
MGERARAELIHTQPGKTKNKEAKKKKKSSKLTTKKKTH